MVGAVDIAAYLHNQAGLWGLSSNRLKEDPFAALAGSIVICVLSGLKALATKCWVTDKVMPLWEPRWMSTMCPTSSNASFCQPFVRQVLSRYFQLSAVGGVLPKIDFQELIRRFLDMSRQSPSQIAAVPLTVASSSQAGLVVSSSQT